MAGTACAGMVARAPRPVSAGMLKRVASAVVLVPLFVWIVLGAPGWVFDLLVVVVSAAAFWELARMFERAHRPVETALGVLLAAILTASFAVPAQGGMVPPYPVLAMALAIGATLATPLMAGAPLTTEPAANTLLGVAYVGWLLGYALLLRAFPDGNWLVLFLAGVTWVGESAAYLVGSVLGRRRLAPIVSPRKTVEGAAAQLLVSVGAGALLGRWLLPQCGIGNAAIAGGLLGVVGQVGDLVESTIKRSMGTKDTGGIIPGHGGLLDRIDGLLFNVPVFYVYALSTGCAR